MDTDAQRESVRMQAKVAREVAAELREAAQGLRAVSAELRRRGSARVAERRDGASRRLVSTTTAVDDGLVGWGLMRPFIEFDSVIVGRDVAIEDAKTLLCEQYGISRGEAYAILQRASSRSNRKLREIAGKLVAESTAR
jgi:ANTAR domain-containing protein